MPKKIFPFEIGAANQPPLNIEEAAAVMSSTPVQFVAIAPGLPVVVPSAHYWIIMSIAVNDAGAAGGMDIYIEGPDGVRYTLAYNETYFAAVARMHCNYQGHPFVLDEGWGLICSNNGLAAAGYACIIDMQKKAEEV